MLYILQGELYRNQDNFSKPIVIYKEFREKNILEARNKCFNSFQSYIDVFLDSLNLDYVNHTQTIIDIKDFLYSKKDRNKIGLPIVENGIGINISFVYDDEIEYKPKNTDVKFYKGIKVIHGIENEKDVSLKEIYLKNLKFEFKKLSKLGIIFPKNIIDEKLRIIKTPYEFDK